MLIRLARDGDLAPVLELDHVAHDGDAGRRRYLAEHLEQGQMLVADDDGTIAGYVVQDCSFFEHGFVHLLYVSEPHRGRGVGAALLAAAVLECGTARVFTSTNLSNARMQRLLRAQGWTPSGTVYGLDEGDPELFYFIDAG